MTAIRVPELALVVLVGASGSGKSTLARRLFRPSEVVSSDVCRYLVADDENDQTATAAAFEVAHLIVRKRLQRWRPAVVDATNVERRDRGELLAIARELHVPAVAVVLDLPVEVALARNATRADRRLDDDVVRRQHGRMRRSIETLADEGFRRVVVLRSTDEVDGAVLERERLPTDRRDEEGPFDIIGDVHGCIEELVVLLERLGYDLAPDRSTAHHVGARRAVFLGDLVDRGPDTPAVLRLVMGMVRDGAAICVPGNHDHKLARALRGADVSVSPGRALALAQLDACPPSFREEVASFLEGLVSHAVLDGGRLVVAHAGLPKPMHNRVSPEVRRFALYGATTGEVDEHGRPVRLPWADDYGGRATVVYGHTPQEWPVWVNNTICIDTGCVFGGRLTALRWPERELVDVRALRAWYEPHRPAALPDEVV